MKILSLGAAYACAALAAFGDCANSHVKEDGGPYRETVKGIEWTYNVRDGLAHVGDGDMPAVSIDVSGDLSIPCELGGHPVASINAGAFSGCWRLTSISIPEGIKSIGASAFASCRIHQFDLPHSLKCLDITAFDFFGSDIFSVSIHSDVESVEGKCPTYVETTIYTDSGDSDRVKNLIESHMQYSTEGIKYIERKPNGGPYTEQLGYRQWTWTFDVVQGNAVITGASSINGNDFQLPAMLGGCPVTEIADDALASSRNIVAMLIPAGLVKVGERAFESCTLLESVVLPATLKSIGSNAFSGCSKLANITIPDSVATIGACAFLGCGLMNVVLPQDISTIGEYMFYGCSKLKFVGLPPGVTSIGFEAFGDCTSLESVEIRTGVKSIAEDAFGGCSKLNTIVVERGDEDRIKGLLETSGVNVAKLKFEVLKCEDGEGYSEVVDGIEWSFSVKNSESHVERVVLPSGTKSVTLPSELGGRKVVSVGYGLFEDSEITSVAIQEGVVTIKPYAFCGCEKLASVSLPNSLKVIEHHAFRYCKSLKEVEIPEGVTRIGYRAFNCFDYDCVDEVLSSGALVNVSLPKSLLFLGDEVFSGTPYGESQNAKLMMNANNDGEGFSSISVVTTNVNVHYVINSVQPSLVLPATYDTGFVNVITEVKGGCVAVPATWSVNYPNFISKFGSDFTKALAMKTGKRDGAGNEMFVWQDYVAGTDPTKEDDVFTASITIVDGKVVISYTPELDDARKAMRQYTTWGKKSLMDRDWAVVPEGHESEYNFFKVTVEMK